MTIDFSISQLIDALQRSEGFDPQFADVLGDTSLSRTEYGAHGSPYYVKSELGVEYFLPVTITYPESTDTGINGESVEINTKLDLPFPLISIQAQKVLVQTVLTERAGTVKQYIATGDYEITVRGWLINKNNEYPEDLLIKLQRLWEKKVPVSIANPITDTFLIRPDRMGSDKVVITSIVIPEVRGIKHSRQYELKMVSDIPFNLIQIQK